MTVLIGIFCSDGVVVGSDSLATSSAAGAGGLPTIGLITPKVDVIADKVITATTGPAGLGQRFDYHVEKHWGNKLFQKHIHEVCTTICQTVLQDFQSTGVPRDSGLGLGFGALLAAPVGDRAFLIEYDARSFQPEVKTEAVMIVSMGSAQIIADPLLGLIKRVFWPDRVPKLAEGIFGALWALELTMALTPSSVGGKPQIAVLERANKGRWTARKLDDDELQEGKQLCDAVEQHLAAFKEVILAGDAETEPPPLPSPPKSGGGRKK